MINFYGYPLRGQLLPVLCLVWLSLSACGGGNHSLTTTDTDKGNLQVRLAWQTESAKTASRAVSPSGDICADFSIDHIRLRVKDASEQIVAESAPLSCSLHTATLDGVKAGSGYRLEVDALIGEEVAWYGDSADVTVVAGKSTPPILVEMNYMGAEGPPPTATIWPEDADTNLHTEIAITIAFDRAMVPASLNTDSVVVSDGDGPISGTVTYHPDSREAVFQPDQPLAILTTYTVAVTTAVMDRFGQNMAQELSSQFTTSTVWFVDQGQAASGTGESWGEAFGTITEAVTASGDGDQIWVKEGTYLLAGQIVVDKAVWLLGGFEGTETQHFQRDWIARETIVDADGGNYRRFYVSADATLDGFTIVGGRLIRRPDTKAGAVYIDAASPRIENCVIKGNISGGTTEKGGAIYIEAGDPYIVGCTFSGNGASGPMGSYGGAIYNHQGGPTIVDCIFKNNGAGNDSSYGGAIYNNEAKSTTLIKNCEFISNSASAEGYSYGGAIYNNLSPVSILGCRFEGNACYGDPVSGGAIHNQDSDALIQNSVFSGHRLDSLTEASGGAIGNHGSSPVITNCTFYANEAWMNASYGTSTYGGAVASFGDSHPTIVNTILWGNLAHNGAQLYDDDTSITAILFSNVDQGLPSGNHNIRKAPRFSTDLHLGPDSPCINAADTTAAPALDMDGESRPQGDEADMGADEFLESDGDGMPDYWESRYNVDDAAADGDEDGITNLSEYFLGTDPNAADTVLGAADRGRVQSDGTHQAADQRASIGGTGYRAFFIFTGVPFVGTDAALRLELAGYQSDAIPETIQIWDVDTAAALLAADTCGVSGEAIYDDLGSGILYGEFEVKPTDANTVVDIQLNRAAVEAINSAHAGSGEFIIGIKVEENMDNGLLLFSEADETRVHQLVLGE